jgi:hypothetical protein
VRCINWWGDGFHCSARDITVASSRAKNVTLINCSADNNRRNGLSLVGVDGCRIYGGDFSNTVGVAPSAGMDLEAEHPNTPNADVRCFGTNFRGNLGPSVSMGGTLNRGVSFHGCTFEASAGSFSLDSHLIDVARFYGCNFLGPILSAANCYFSGCRAYSDATWTAVPHVISADFDARFLWEGGEIIAGPGGQLVNITGALTADHTKILRDCRLELQGNALADLSTPTTIGGLARLERVRFIHTGAAPATGYFLATNRAGVRFLDCDIDPLLGRGFANGSVSFSPETGIIANTGFNCGPGRIETRGDVGATLTPFYNATVQRWTATLTANRVVTLSTDGGWVGAEFLIFAANTGAFTLTIEGVALSGTNKSARFLYDGTAWRLVGS